MFILDVLDNKPKEQRNRIEASIGLVVYVLKKMKLMHNEDCLSEGLVGLVEADRYFNENLGISWSTYAVISIRNTIAMYLKRFIYKPVAYETEIISDDKKYTIEHKLQFENFVSKLTDLQRHIVQCIAYHDLNKTETMRVLNISRERLDKELLKLKFLYKKENKL